MLIEGLHVEGVDAVLFLRRTESYIVTLQQLGRCLDAGAGKQPVVLDFVNNLSGKSVYDVMAPPLGAPISPSVTQRIRREHLFSDDRFSVGHTAAHRGDIGRTGALADYV